MLKNLTVICLGFALVGLFDHAALAQNDALVPALIKALQDPDENVRIHAASSLCTLDKAALPALLNAMEAKDDSLRAEAAGIVGSMGTHGRRHLQALPALTKLVQDKNAKVRMYAAYAISQIVVDPKVEPDKQLVSALIIALDDSEKMVQTHASSALCQLDVHALPSLLKVLDGQGKARAIAARTVGSMGTMGRRHQTALPALAKALEDEDAEVRRWASYAISQIVVSPKK